LDSLGNLRVLAALNDFLVPINSHYMLAAAVLGARDQWPGDNRAKIFMMAMGT
jgi:hypothetical protein